MATVDGVLTSDFDRAVERTAKAFTDLDVQNKWLRAEQGRLCAELREAYGPEALTELASRTGHRSSHLLSLASFYETYGPQPDIDPAVSLELYVTAARETEQVLLDGADKAWIDRAPHEWAKQAHEGNWGSRALRAAIREYYGTNGLLTLIQMEERADETLAAFTNGNAVYWPDDRSRHLAERLSFDSRPTGEVAKLYADVVCEPLKGRARDSITRITESMRAHQRGNRYRGAASEPVPERVAVFRIVVHSDRSGEELRSLLQNALRVAGCSAVTVRELREPCATQDAVSVVA